MKQMKQMFCKLFSNVVCSVDDNGVTPLPENET